MGNSVQLACVQPDQAAAHTVVYHNVARPIVGVCIHFLSALRTPYVTGQLAPVQRLWAVFWPFCAPPQVLHDKPKVLHSAQYPPAAWAGQCSHLRDRCCHQRHLAHRTIDLGFLSQHLHPISGRFGKEKRPTELTRQIIPLRHHLQWRTTIATVQGPPHRHEEVSQLFSTPIQF